jgi:dihydroorotase
MNCCIKNVTIVNKVGNYHLKQCDVLIRNGIITKIASQITADKKDKIINAKGMYLSAGWFDMFTSFGDPGYEHKETINSGLNAAAAGGFTDVLLLPNTNPVIDNKSGITYYREKAKGHITNLHTAGSITTGASGKDLAELYDMHIAGAIAFTDGERSVQDSGVIVRALQYVKPFRGVIINKANDRSISQQGVINEGKMSALLGLKPIPALAEEIIVMRDIQLAQYANAPIIIGPISTSGSVELIRQAQKKKNQVSCFVLSHHLYLNETALEHFDSNLKLNPPLRTTEDIKSLHKGIDDGTISAIASGHHPQNEELKKVEFDYAAFGAINLQTSFSVANTGIPNFTPELIAEKFSEGPRKLLNLSPVIIKEGEPACLTLFDTNADFTFTADVNKSMSSNSPYLNKTLKGRPVAIINNNQLQII